MPRQKARDAINYFLDRQMDSFATNSSWYEGFKMRDLHILAFIDRTHEDHMVTVSELAYHLNVTPAAASQFVTAYEKKGWVERIRSDKDRRTVHVKVTDKINRIFDERLQKIDEKADEVLADFSDEEILAFSRILKAIDGKLGITLNPQDKKK